MGTNHPTPTSIKVNFESNNLVRQLESRKNQTYSFSNDVRTFGLSVLHVFFPSPVSLFLRQPAQWGWVYSYPIPLTKTGIMGNEGILIGVEKSRISIRV